MPRRPRLPPRAPPCSDPLCVCRQPLPAYPREVLPCGDYVNGDDAAWSLTITAVAGGQDTSGIVRPR